MYERSDSSRIFGLALDGAELRASMESAREVPIERKASRATLVIGVSSRRSDRCAMVIAPLSSGEIVRVRRYGAGGRVCVAV